MSSAARRLARCAVLGLALATVLAARCTEPPDDLLLLGTVERTLIEVAPPMSEQILAIPVAPGQHVGVGDVLVRLDSLLSEADLAAARASVAGAQTQTEVALQEHRRAASLRGSGVTSEAQLDRARLARDEASALLRSAMARMAVAQKRVNDTTIVAPVAGTVDQLPFDAGERVAAGSVVAVLLADGKPWVRVWVPERAFARVHPGTLATIRIDGIPSTLHGHLLDLGREASFTPHYALTERERIHLVYQGRVDIDDAPIELRPGAPAEVRIALPPLASDEPTP